MERILLTPMEAANVLHIGRTKIYDLIRNGELTSIKIGKLRRIPVEGGGV
jgi:excisionase family DNA binding protein